MKIRYILLVGVLSCVVQADISVFPQHGAPLSTVTVQGCGFPAKEPIRIDLGLATNIAQDLRDSSYSSSSQAQLE
jgi:hypothetical protein